MLIAILLLSGKLALVPGLLILATLAPGAYLFNRYVLSAKPQQETAKPTGPSKMERLARYADSIIQSSPDVVVIIDTDHKVEEANRAARRMFGDRIDGKNFFQILRQPEAVTAMEQALAEGAQGSVEIMLLNPGERHFILNVVPMRATAEQSAEPQPVAGAFVVLHEITALKRSEQMRADFVANASHELRTPLASLIGFIETLQGPAQED
ncbi:MAG: histidine kinase dimerization/phospho-acceptor domain-containing protein, partial [Alphaproteobacteria bacterium]|nr:histidine kinase dimerization/phospho-acceptor domain-containing protein [Alphaproteobacteria bacterium]